MLTTLSKILVRILPTNAALFLIRTFVRRSQRPTVTDDQRAALAAATRIHYGDASKVAWSWGSGPLIVFVHGWNGRAAQLAPLAQQIAWEGYRCVCIDVTAHGESAGNHPAWRHFIDDIAAAATDFGQAYAFIGHSAGGLATLAAARLQRIYADSFVCVSTPSHPYPPIRVLQQLLDPPRRVLDRCRHEIARDFGTTWERLEHGEVWKSANAPLLLFHDYDDRYIEHTDGDRIVRWSADSRVEKSSGYGHTRVLASDELARAIVRFLDERSVLLRCAAGGSR